MKRVLIISPHFPPVNAADMQRIRMSLPYFKEFGWEAEVVVVNDQFVDIVKDPLLLETIPHHLIIHKVNALNKHKTSRFGLGSLALRSIYYYFRKVNELLKSKSFDLIYFSTTEFNLCILGAYWKARFKIPYLIDMQDPWHTEYYRNKPKEERPKKYWFSYRLNKLLEPIAMKSVDGLIAVSSDYIATLKKHYPDLKNKPSKVITFGGFEPDFEIASKNTHQSNSELKKNNFLNLVYVGRAGYDMKQALEILFQAFKKGLTEQQELFTKVRLHFIGTSYAPKGRGIKTVEPISNQLGIENFIIEHTDRIPYYEGLNLLKQADGLIIIGSSGAEYTASKLFPYILAKKQLLGVFNKKSSSAEIIATCNAGHLITLEQSLESSYAVLLSFVENLHDQLPPATNWKAFEPYTAKSLTLEQVKLFDQIVNS